jgi:hypothetical protein
MPSFRFIIRVRRCLTMPDMMPVIHEQVNMRASENQKICDVLRAPAEAGLEGAGRVGVMPEEKTCSRCG